MKIYLLDINKTITDIWKLYFADCEDVEVVCDYFDHFMDQGKVDCVVSPANSYGLMDGGYDRAISEWFGWDLMKKVQKYILDNYWGEQPVGTSFIIDPGKDNIKLIHTPSMRIPSAIKDTMVVYQCMRTTLMTAIKNNVESIVIPAFGGFCGCLQPIDVCSMMYEAYKQIMNPPLELTWDYAERWRPEYGV